MQASGRNAFGLDLRAKGAPLLYVFDFDQTILAIHSFGSRIRAADVSARNLAEDVADQAFFKQFIDAVLASGVPVAIASFGEYQVIQNYMDRIAPDVFNRNNICTPTCVGYQDGSSVPQGKVPMLELLLQGLISQSGGAAPTDQQRARTVLFDDDDSNIRRAAAAGYIACYTPDAFTRTAWPQIKEYMPENVRSK